jgi:hypothetical protein
MIGNIPVYVGVYPNSNITNDNDYALAVFDFIDFHGNTLIPHLNNNFLPALSGVITQIHTTAKEVSDNKDIVTTKTNTVIEKASQSNQSAIDAKAIVDATVAVLDNKIKIFNDLKAIVNLNEIETITDSSTAILALGLLTNTANIQKIRIEGLTK